MPSQEEIQIFMQSLGLLGWVIYFFWGTLSVILVPLNFSAVGLGAGFIHGTLLGGIGNWICKIIGTTISFFLTRKLGNNLVKKIVPQKINKKFSYLIDSPHSLFIYAFFCFIPMMPSDAMAYILGLSKVSSRKFIILNVFANLGTAFSLSYLGSGGAFKDPIFLGIFIFGLLSGIYAMRHLQGAKAQPKMS